MDAVYGAGCRSGDRRTRDRDPVPAPDELLRLQAGLPFRAARRDRVIGERAEKDPKPHLEAGAPSRAPTGSRSADLMVVFTSRTALSRPGSTPDASDVWMIASRSFGRQRPPNPRFPST